MLHRIDDLAVAGAAAQHAAHGVHDLVVIGRLVMFEKIGRRHQHAGRADTTLGRAVFVKGLLQVRQAPIHRRKTFNRHHIAIGNLCNGYEAGTYLFAIEQYRAGAAIAGVAADLGTGKAEVFA